MIGSTAAPQNGERSLTDQEIYQLYLKYLHRDPDPTELASEQDNSTRYSAAGIERQIALRAGNTAGSGIRGDEGLPSLTVQPPPVLDHHLGNVITMGPSAIVEGPSTTGPTGTIPAMYGGGGSALAPQYYGSAGSSTILGMSPTTLAIIAVMLGAGWYFMRAARR